MRKEQLLPSDTSIPDPLKIFAKKIGQKIHDQVDKNAVSKVTARELLTTLTPIHSQLGCLPLIRSSDKCNELNDNIKTIFVNVDDSEEKLDKTLKKVFNDTEKRIEKEEEEEEESETQCSTSLTNELEMSYDGKWLRNIFKLPLKMAIKEIVSTKPYDPVSYLGFWLLNYRRCQERRQWQLEKDNELNYLRSLVEEPVSKEEKISVDTGEEEEENHDRNFKYYESVHIDF